MRLSVTAPSTSATTISPSAASLCRHKVAVRYPRVDHGLAVCFEQKELAPADERRRQAHITLAMLVLLGKTAARHVAEYRDRNALSVGTAHRRGLVPELAEHQLAVRFHRAQIPANGARAYAELPRGIAARRTVAAALRPFLYICLDKVFYTPVLTAHPFLC